MRYLSFLLLLPSIAHSFTTPRISQLHQSDGTLRSNFVAPRAKIIQKRPLSFLSRRRLVIVAGWGPDPIWETATVVSTAKACESCVSLTLDVGEEKAKEYEIPGQYVQVKVAGDDEAKPVFLAIASPPITPEEDGFSKSQFEFLIKKTDNNAWITDAIEGNKFDVSQVLGNGFKIKENIEGFKYDFPTQNVIFFAAGSGIAPIRAAIESKQLGLSKGNLDKDGLGGGRTARLYYGVRNPDEMAYWQRFLDWENLGVQVVPVVSQPEGTKWNGRAGYIQTALEEDGVPVPRNSAALMCGMKGMTESVKEILLTSGVFEGRILTNF